MAYSEIINEIQEQIQDITAQITATNEQIAGKLLEIEELEAKIPQFDEQIAGLQQLRTNAQTLIDSAGEHNINLNINVSSGGNTAYSGSSKV